MSKINGIYAASVSVLDKELNLNVDKTIKPVSYTHLTLPTSQYV